MLIINADDLGRNQVATDRILTTYREGRITSASAMMFMADSKRAATEAIVCGIPLGLHINLTEKLTDPSVPVEVARAHQRVASFLKRSKYALIVYNPFLRRFFRTLVTAQHTEYIRLFGHEPTHFDGHQHMHLATNMLVGKLLPEGTKIRRNFTFTHSEKGSASKFYRMIVDRTLAKRHILADSFYCLSDYMTIDRLKPIILAANMQNVELMTHPEREEEFNYLRQDDYASLIAQVPTGSYRAMNSSVSH